ncbi:NADPH-dependent FMN reductase [Saccharothrix violaceirubra]|uniref:FMN reductase n=1 Tax=Saccharothrix violaceirubra TaxID=413306 RepID=A0A7W7WTL5_9PSEU|nr:NAD(P)H-dependent oxidoreductase [Saccharothrix violaceirubra]MBB4963305.1 FMN reductase [Saccharothrix violaceirubra]
MTHVVGTLVGNPRPGSRTLNAALALSDAVRTASGGSAGPVVDAAEIATELFAPGSTAVRDALESLSAADILVVASPTYKATYTGLLKAVLDQAPGGWLRGKTVVPLLVAASDRHALAVELHLRPVLVELGGSVPGRGLFLNESALAEPAGLTAGFAELLTEAGWFTTPVGV